MTISRQSELSEWAPFRVTPRFVERVWGSNDLRPWYDQVANGNPIGEAWLTGDDCEVATGPHAGRKLGELFTEAPQALLGSGVHDAGSPLLLKVKRRIRQPLLMKRQTMKKWAASPACASRWRMGSRCNGDLCKAPKYPSRAAA